MFMEAKGKVVGLICSIGRFTKHQARRFVDYLFDPTNFDILLVVLFFVSALNYMLLVWSADTVRQNAPVIIPSIIATVTGTSTRTATSTPTHTLTNTPTITVTPPWDLVVDSYFATLPYPLMRDADDWTVSTDGVRFAAFWEGFSSTPYDDGGQPGVGNCTIGYGHLLHLGPCTGSEGGSISQTQAYALLEQELNHCGTFVAKYTTVRLTQVQYNILAGAVCGYGYDRYRTSEMLQLLNQGRYYDAAERMKTTGIYGIGIGLCPGLVRRRNTEADMFLKSPGFIMWPFVEKARQ